ncbi:MAG: T9SS type A sorting domain-containing protein [Melioribacteraceae bacterium]|nr:T9SS type A sorting domain-containing protein [Melioribacteraceae bacterium]
MTSKCPVLAFLIFFIITSQPINTWAQTINIIGKTSDSRFEGSGIPNIEVSISDKDHPDVVFGKDTTDADGLWGFDNLITSIADNEPHIPDIFSLSQNYPNPFNPSTNVIFSNPASGYFNFEIFDALGRLVDRMDNIFLNVGSHKFVITAPSASGVYIYRLSNNDGSYSGAKKFIALDGSKKQNDLIKYLGTATYNNLTKTSIPGQLAIEFNALDQNYDSKTETIENISQTFDVELEQIARQKSASIQGSYTSNPAPEIDLEGMQAEIKLDGNTYSYVSVSGGTFDVDGIVYDYFVNPQNPDDELIEFNEASVILTGDNLGSSSKTVDFSEDMDVGELVLEQRIVQEQANLSGNVKDDSQNNLQGVNVTANGNHIQNSSDNTDSQGNYNITLNFDSYPYSPSIILPNNLNVNGSKTGYNPDNTTIPFNQNGMTADLELEKIVTGEQYVFVIDHRNILEEDVVAGIILNVDGEDHEYNGDVINVDITADNPNITITPVPKSGYQNIAFATKENPSSMDLNLYKWERNASNNFQPVNANLQDLEDQGIIKLYRIRSQLQNNNDTNDLVDLESAEVKRILTHNHGTGYIIRMFPDEIPGGEFIFSSPHFEALTGDPISPSVQQENTEELIKVALLGNYPYRISEPVDQSDPDWQYMTIPGNEDFYYTQVMASTVPGHGNFWGTATNGLIEQDYGVAKFTQNAQRDTKHSEMMSAIYNLADQDGTNSLGEWTYNLTTMQPTILAEWFAQFVTTTDYFKYDN